MARECIRVRGARQNNLKNVDLDLPLGELVVITGVSGSGKSSLAFDTIYAEGQRRYIETFSAYARQFLDRMDKPDADSVSGVLPAIAIDQTNPVRTSRSTVGTMTELNDHLKLLFARAATLYCARCGDPVVPDSPQGIVEELLGRERGGDGEHPHHGERTGWGNSGEDGAEAARAVVGFRLPVPDSISTEELQQLLAARGFVRLLESGDGYLDVVADRLRLAPAHASRLQEAVETALRQGGGRAFVQPTEAPQQRRWFSTGLHCARCDLAYAEAVPNHFSFNSPLGACETCRGFGRTIGIDYELVVPDGALTLRAGAVKPFRTPRFASCQRDLQRHARKAGVSLDRPWRELTPPERQWVIDGEGDWEEGRWYGLARFFEWLESKSYKMHIRVLLSKYRAYRVCPACDGARLKPESLLWRLHGQQRHPGAEPNAPAGCNLHELTRLPIDECAAFFERLALPHGTQAAAAQLLQEIQSRLSFLNEVGLGYLTLDRQSRTLSGGEVQRINLTTALGTRLVNTLFVLDEPSIGLHPRDIARLLRVLQRLRDAGNSLLVVEHDPQLMLAADRIIDMGPGPGERGGRVVFSGTPRALLRSRRSATASWLRGDALGPRGASGSRGDSATTPPHAGRSPARPHRDPVTSEDPVKTGDLALEILGAAEHNLKDLDVRLPLRRMVSVTGVSGSGKSTLLAEICYRGLCKLKGRAQETPGRHREIRGHELVDDVVLVDQSPIGKTARSNPASFVGAFEAIRKAFCAAPLARARDYKPGTFSFNAGDGRCPACGGSGFEHVEMQFLSDVYLRCPDCDGRRYRPEVLEVTLEPPGGGAPASIADVLAMTVTEATGFFAGNADVQRSLQPLIEVGLDYLRLGQPLPTLSGGEAQRLKLAAFLADAAAAAKAPGGTLFLFDEPTTGLHFQDISVLLGAFRRLLGRGHSLVIIEHNLDVIAASDWVVDLGPEGGSGGGELVVSGPPDAVERAARSHTGRELAAYRRELASRREAAALPAPGRDGTIAAAAVAEDTAGYAWRDPGRIEVRNAREHNLRGVDVEIPRNRLTVITGVSGSGKSTLAFDILFAEGQRRYLESLNAYARQFVQPASRADVDAVAGLPPTVAIEQRTSRGGQKSTVATLTETWHYLRLLFVRLGTPYCPDCELPIHTQSPEQIAARLLERYRGKRLRLLAPLVVARKGYYTDLARWAAARGARELRVDGRMLPTDPWPRLDRFREHDIEMPVAELTVDPTREAALRAAVQEALGLGQGLLLAAPAAARGRGRDELFSSRRACSGCGKSFPELDPRLFSYNSRQGWCPRCCGTGRENPELDEHGEERPGNGQADAETCRACAGRRLRPEALAVRFHQLGIAEVGALPVTRTREWLTGLRLEARERAVAESVVAEIVSRLRFLEAVGLGYLALDRGAPTLSGGEAQRIRLAAQLGSNLRGVCYILDEPTIGLHPRDNRMLLDTLRTLRGQGNTVVVVEHDEETIRAAEHVVDLGPGAGVGGGRVIAQGSLKRLLATRESLTGRMLAQPPSAPPRPRRAFRRGIDPSLRIANARVHNLHGLDVEVPLERLVCLTGVSGSGKSTLLRQVLRDNLERQLGRRGKRGATRPIACERFEGAEGIDRLLEVDQTPIGKTPRSCPATYVGFWDDVRRLFAATPEARLRGFGPGRFSFNTGGGRCDTCEGQGVRRIAMSFLPDVRVPCETCGGTRFDRETRSILYRGRSIDQILALSAEEALEIFPAHRRIHHALQLLVDVGLGYLTLGQQSPTLSGGEAQRIKLVAELARAVPNATRPGGQTIYLLDEPTIGLHMADVEKLIAVLHRLVDAGNSVVVIEHNLEVVAAADWILDLGPEGGDRGGRVVARGTPEQVATRRRSHTAEALRRVFTEAAAGTASAQMS